MLNICVLAINSIWPPKLNNGIGLVIIFKCNSQQHQQRVKNLKPLIKNSNLPLEFMFMKPNGPIM